MNTKKIVPCLDIRGGMVVKGVNFEGIKEVGDPVELARFYNDEGADELVFYDISAAVEGRGVLADLLKRVAQVNRVPLTVAGGVMTADDFGRVLELGADKVSVNSGVIKNPALISDAAKKYGSGRVVFAMDVKRVNGRFHVFAKAGSEDTGIDALQWAVRGEQNGAGELVVNSIDTDGVKAGYDMELLGEVASRVSIPIVASGGAGKPEHFAEVFGLKGISAGLAASIFHYREVSIRELKGYLAGCAGI
ncbi:MAG: imidazole glycerol phosphate synthase subunit HisF [Oscillospiraceae bacterium]|nr:imidazole glycerol phosphate synthase subunit HisF [Oscillospiraceae bacterium]